MPTSEDLLDPDHLNWTAKQGRILTANGQANVYYDADRGFPFSEDQLPHYHLMKGLRPTAQV